MAGGRVCVYTQCVQCKRCTLVANHRAFELFTNWNQSILNLAEKFAITHAEKYFITNEHLLLPAIEYIYIWNLFAIIEKDKRLITPILDRVEKKIGQYKNEIGRRRIEVNRSLRKCFRFPLQHTNCSSSQSSESDQLSTDNICLLMLLKGVCLRTLGYPYQALESLQQVLKQYVFEQIELGQFNLHIYLIQQSSIMHNVKIANC